MSTGTQNLGTEKVGARVYVIGNSFPIKDKLKSLGCHWDGERRQWWIGTAKAAAVESLVGDQQNNPQAGAVTKSKVSDDSRLAGKGKYKGRTYYILWMGRCSSGAEKARLTVLDGSIDFWVDLSAVEIIKRYSPREYRGRTEYTTLGSIRSFIARVKDDEKDGGESPLKYPRTGCSCGSREGITQDTDCESCRFDAD